MLEPMRTPFFWAAVAAFALAVLGELGAVAFIEVRPAGASSNEIAPAGHGIPCLALLDGMLLYTVLLTGLGMILPGALHGRIQGIVSLVVSLLAVLGGIAMALTAFGLLVLMVVLVSAVPFGTAIYIGRFGDFPRQEAATALTAIFALKIAFAVLLALAHQRFLKRTGLVLLTVCSLIATLLLSLLHGIVPGFLVSITDMIGALVASVLGIVWALVILVATIPSIFKAVG